MLVSQKLSRRLSGAHREVDYRDSAASPGFGARRSTKLSASNIMVRHKKYHEIHAVNSDKAIDLYSVLVFIRSYCHTVWLASSCRPYVCLWRCALWLSGLVYRAKSCTSVFLVGMFLFVPSDTFAVGCIDANIGTPWIIGTCIQFSFGLILCVFMRVFLVGRFVVRSFCLFVCIGLGFHKTCL